MANVDNPTQLPHGQFSLRAVLILVTAAAGLCALGAAIRANSALLLGGIFLALANYLGMLVFIQRRRFAQIALYAAFAAFVISMLLPVDRNDDSRGWQYPWIAAKAGYEVLTAPAGIFFSEITPRAIIVSWTTLLTLANVAMILSPIFAHQMAVGRAKWLGVLIALSAPAAWAVTLLFGLSDTSGLTIGYYVWCGAVTIGVVVLPMTPGRFSASLLVALWFVLSLHLIKPH